MSKKKRKKDLNHARTRNVPNIGKGNALESQGHNLGDSKKKGTKKELVGTGRKRNPAKSISKAKKKLAKGREFRPLNPGDVRKDHV